MNIKEAIIKAYNLEKDQNINDFLDTFDWYRQDLINIIIEQLEGFQVDKEELANKILDSIL